MRRILHSVLVLLVVAALVAPLSGSDAAVGTPICCLGKGEHQCLGDVHSPAGAAPQGFSSAAEKCPYLPLALAAMHGPDLAPPVAAGAVAVTSSTAPVALVSQCFVCASPRYARPERGPPPSSLD